MANITVPTKVERLVRHPHWPVASSLQVLNTKIDNLIAAIEHGGQIAALVEHLAERQKERDTLRTEMASAETLYQISVDRPKIESEVQQEVANWRGLLGSAAVADGREFLRKVLAEPIRFMPDGKQYRFRGPTRMGELIAGAVLLDRVASPMFASWNQIGA